VDKGLNLEHRLAILLYGKTWTVSNFLKTFSWNNFPIVIQKEIGDMTFSVDAIQRCTNEKLFFDNLEDDCLMLPHQTFGPDIFIKSKNLILVIQQKNQSKGGMKTIVHSTWTTLKPFKNDQTGASADSPISVTDDMVIIRCVMTLNIEEYLLNLTAILNEEFPKEKVFVLDSLKTYEEYLRPEVFEIISKKSLNEIERDFSKAEMAYTYLSVRMGLISEDPFSNDLQILDLQGKFENMRQDLELEMGDLKTIFEENRIKFQSNPNKKLQQEVNVIEKRQEVISRLLLMNDNQEFDLNFGELSNIPSVLRGYNDLKSLRFKEDILN